MTDDMTHGSPHGISVVVPVHQGERHLQAVVDELLPLVHPFLSPDRHLLQVVEIILVYDPGPDDSARVIRELAEKHEIVRPVWLSRNFGQHAATLAGMASSGGDWVLTMDEDGQHDPGYVAAMLDCALRASASLVYARPTNPPPHGLARNATSRGAKRLLGLMTGSDRAAEFHSFRLMLGEIGRSVAAYAGSGVYLDVALGWVAGPHATCPVVLRDEGERRSGYSTRSLVSHFWRMVLTSGTRGLRLVSAVGAAFATVGIVAAIALVVNRLTDAGIMAGWTSNMVVILVTSGAVLFSLGVVAEYVGVAVNMAMGKPLYVIVNDPAKGPLGRVADDR